MMRSLVVSVVMLVAATACADGGQASGEGTPTDGATAVPPTPTSPDASPTVTGQHDGAAIGTLAYIDRTFDQPEEQTPRLLVVDLPKGESQVVAEGALTGTVWSPTGDRVVYIGRPESPEQPSQEQLRVADVEAGTTTTAATGNFSAPDWALDGDRVAVANNQPGERDPNMISVVDLRDGQVRAVTDPAAGTDDLEPVWSPDGRRIAFVRNTHGDPTSTDPGDVRIITVAADGSDRRELAPGLFDESAAAWSPDGDTIAVTAAASAGVDAPRDLYMAPVDGGQARPLNIAGARHHVTFSPDGQLLAVVAGTQPDDTDIHIVNVSDASTIAVFDGDMFDTSPTWSPDGSHVAFVAATGLEGQADLALGEIASGQVRMLTEDGSVQAPDFAPR